jgi:hypothetical protein
MDRRYFVVVGLAAVVNVVLGVTGLLLLVFGGHVFAATPFLVATAVEAGWVVRWSTRRAAEGPRGGEPRVSRSPR